MAETLRVCTESFTYTRTNELSAQVLADALCNQLHEEVRVLDAEDNVLYVFLPHGREASK